MDTTNANIPPQTVAQSQQTSVQTNTVVENSQQQTSPAAPPAPSVSEEYLESLGDSSSKPFYKEWTFWVLMVLILVLFGVVGYLLIPKTNDSFDAEVLILPDIVKLHVKKLNVSDKGFLIFQKDENGLPGALFEISPFIVPDNYTDFYVPFIPDDVNTLPYYQALAATGRFYVSFYIDTGDSTFKKEQDTEIAKGKDGKTLQLKFVAGKVVEK